MRSGKFSFKINFKKHCHKSYKKEYKKTQMNSWVFLYNKNVIYAISVKYL